MVWLNVLSSQLLCLCKGHLRKNTTLWWLLGCLVGQFVFLFYVFRKFLLQSRAGLWCQKRPAPLALCLSMQCSLQSVFFGMSFLIFRTIFSFSLGSISKRYKKSAAVFIFPGTCAMVNLDCNTKPLAFYMGGQINFVWKNLATDLLSIMIITGLVAPQRKCQNSLKVR